VVIHPSGKFAYAVHATAVDSVSAYSVDPTSGMLTLIDTFATGAEPRLLCIDPSGRFAYVSNLNGESVSIYAIHDDGVLEESGTFSAGGRPLGLAVHQAGALLLVAAGQTISSLRIGADGGLTLADATVTSAIPMHLSISPNGNFVYVQNNDNSISTYSINSATGAFGPAVTLENIGEGELMIFGPEGAFAYLPLASAIIAFTVAPDGTLSLAQALQPLQDLAGLAVSPSGNALYAINESDATVIVHMIEAGRLTRQLGAPTTLSSPANGITIASFLV
jgi:6-phosphogluconolactonase (cycloisomerase 2 family)